MKNKDYAKFWGGGGQIRSIMKCGNGVYGNFEEKSPGNQVQSSEYLYMACFHPGGGGLPCERGGDARCLA